MRDEGKTTREIAEKFGMTEGAMRCRIHELIMSGELGTLRGRLRWSEEKTAELLRMKSEGRSASEVAGKLDLSFKAFDARVRRLTASGKLPCGILQWLCEGQREYLDSHNLCHRCRKAEKFPSRQYCPECLEKFTLNNIRKYHGRSENDRERSRERYKAFKAAGLCVKCGRPAKSGLFCYECSIKDKRHSRERVRRHEGNQSNRELRMAARLCLDCGKPIEDGNDTKLCYSCRKKRSERAREARSRA